MAKLFVILLLVLGLGMAGGLVYVAFWDIPPPTHTVEKVLPNETLQH